MQVILAAMVILSSWISSAAAQWIVQPDEDPFSKTKQVLIFAPNLQGYGFGFRCESGGTEPTVIFLTTEDMSSQQASTISNLQPKLLIIVDALPVVSISGELDSANGKLRFLGTTTQAIDLMRLVGKARQRIAVTIEMVGQRMHTTKFGVSRSSSAVKRAFDVCELEQRTN